MLGLRLVMWRLHGIYNTAAIMLISSYMFSLQAKGSATSVAGPFCVKMERKNITIGCVEREDITHQLADCRKSKISLLANRDFQVRSGRTSRNSATEHSARQRGAGRRCQRCSVG